MTGDYVHRLPLAGDGKDSGTGPGLVDLVLQGDARFLAGAGGAVLDGSGDFLDLGGGFAFAATGGFTWCAWVRYVEQVEDFGFLLYLVG